MDSVSYSVCAGQRARGAASARHFMCLVDHGGLELARVARGRPIAVSMVRSAAGGARQRVTSAVDRPPGTPRQRYGAQSIE